jgi:hypothetical protein
MKTEDKTLLPAAAKIRPSRKKLKNPVTGYILLKNL